MDITTHPRRRFAVARLILGIVVASFALGACGGDGATSDDTAQNAAGNGIDRAFVGAMIPHHRSAVQMAKIAGQRGQSTFVKNLAKDITRTQNAEITTLRAIASRLDAAGIKPKSLGVAEHETGMDTSISQLRSADPFDRAFIDMMIPHHQGAIRMARVELAKGADAKAKQLATAIVKAQAREIRAMNKHRAEAFGAPSPAGGVPAESGDTGDAMPSMDHG